MAYLRSQDVAVALQLTLTPSLAYRPLAEAVALSQGETHNAVQRLTAAHLLRADERVVNVMALLEFLEKGVPYAYAASLGPEARGVPTAHSGPSLASDFGADGIVVWPSINGHVRGASVEPLYPGALLTPENNPDLYDFLTLVDALRVGRARERVIAKRMLRERIHATAAAVT